MIKTCPIWYYPKTRAIAVSILIFIKSDRFGLVRSLFWFWSYKKRWFM